MLVSKLNDDIWSEIFSYLDLKCIFTLERADLIFEDILRRTRYWERKIEQKFPECGFDIPEDSTDDPYFIIRRLYWDLYCLSHTCNICKLCFVDNICNKIPDCKLCDWLNYFD